MCSHCPACEGCYLAPVQGAGGRSQSGWQTSNLCCTSLLARSADLNGPSMEPLGQCALGPKATLDAEYICMARCVPSVCAEQACAGGQLQAVPKQPAAGVKLSNITAFDMSSWQVSRSAKSTGSIESQVHGCCSCIVLPTPPTSKQVTCCAGMPLMPKSVSRVWCTQVAAQMLVQASNNWLAISCCRLSLPEGCYSEPQGKFMYHHRHSKYTSGSQRREGSDGDEHGMSISEHGDGSSQMAGSRLGA